MWREIKCGGGWPTGSDGDWCKVWWLDWTGWRYREGKWDTDDNVCIIKCNGAKESTESDARDYCPGSGPGENTCEQVCGADPTCDEYPSNSRLAQSVYCDAGCKAWVVSLSVSNTVILVPNHVTVTATSSYPVENNSYSIIILANDSVVKTCTSGTNCTYEVLLITPGVLVFKAKIMLGSETKAETPSTTVYWVECINDNNCKDASGKDRYDPVSHTKIVCDTSTYTCQPKGSCSVPEDCEDTWCCYTRQMGGDDTCQRQGTIKSYQGKSYLCDPPEGFDLAKKQLTLLDFLLKFNPFSKVS
jgi:hypothetical protein